MAINDRDYYRESESNYERGAELPKHLICFKLIVLNVVVYLLQIFSTREATQSDYEQLLIQMERRIPQGIAEEQRQEWQQHLRENLPSQLPRLSLVEEWFSLDTRKVFQGQIWRVLTCAFCHDRLSILHLVFNMLFLWWWGKTLESMYGPREFLLFYLAGALCASALFMGLDIATGSESKMIGASGAVMATMMLYAIHFPRDRVMIFFVIPVEVRWLVFFYVIFDLHPVLLQLSGAYTVDGVAHAAHLGGFAFGWLYWKYQWHLEPLVGRLSRFRFWWKRKVGTGRNLKVVRVEEEDQRSFEQQLDDVLAKLHEKGRGALTLDEINLLEEGSRRYRSRRGE